MTTVTQGKSPMMMHLGILDRRSLRTGNLKIRWRHLILTRLAEIRNLK
jgi:hypothetical protein